MRELLNFFRVIGEDEQGEMVEPIMQVTSDAYGSDIRKKDAQKLQRTLEQKAEQMVTQEYGDFSIKKKTLEAERQDALSHLAESGQTETEVNAQFDALVQEVADAFKERAASRLQEAVPELCEEVVQTFETQKRQRTKCMGLLRQKSSIRSHYILSSALTTAE